MYSIYKHTCPNNKVYIGITSQEPSKRWCNGFGYKENTRFFRDIVAYGWNNISHEVIAQVETHAEATRIEKILITSHKATNSEYGYNTHGGSLAQCHLHSDASTDSSPQTYIHIDPSTGVSPQNNYDGRGKSSQQVCQYSKDGVLIATFNSMKDASVFTGVNQGDICSCCRGQKADGTPKYTAGGYIWKYAEEKEVG